MQGKARYGELVISLYVESGGKWPFPLRQGKDQFFL